jgi:uncharacterized ParB-like nuclease family protein
VREIALDLLRRPLRAPQVPPDRVDHLALMPGATTPSRVGRDVVGEKLIRIEIGTISGEIEEADLLGVTVHPVSDLRGPVHGVFVHDQEDSGLAPISWTP